MNVSKIKQTWQQQGFCVIPDFLDRDRVARLRAICDRVLHDRLVQQWNDRLVDPAKHKVANIAFLTEPADHQNRSQELIELLEFVADPQILELLEYIAEEPVLFHNTQYFFNPIYQSWQGDWHRDTQFLASEPELEQQRMQQFTAVHFRVAFVEDACFEYIPASEQRWDTPEEYAVRKGESGMPRNLDQLAGRQPIALNPGDALLFHAWGIHRGIYQQDKLRRTLDVIYQWEGVCDYCPPSATCFQDAELLKSLSAPARAFFDRFARAYATYW